MSVITNEYLRYENPVEMTATYSIEIQNFRKKLRKAKKGKSKRRSDSPSISPTKMKKLKLVLGSETVSTVNYSD